MASGVRQRRWSFTRRSRRQSVSQTDDAEQSTTSTQRNNAVDPSLHSTEPKPPTQELETSSLEQVTEIERHLLKRVRLVGTKMMNLWKSAFVWQMAKFCIFVCLCGCLGLCCRYYLSSPSVQLHQFLHDLDLDAYLDGLMEMGYDRVEDVLWATDRDLMEAGIALRPHRIRILHKAHVLQQTGFPWILWSAIAMMSLWLAAVLSFVAAVVFNSEFRTKCAVVGLWAAITIWGRVQTYRRIWRELKETESSNVQREIVLQQ